MSSMSNIMETDLLKLIFQNISLPLIGDATGLVGSTVEGSLYVALHIADPGEAGNQTTSETDYTSYARVAVARNDSNWDVVDDDASNTNLVTWPQCTGGSSTVTHFSIGTDSTGTGKIITSGPLDNSLAVSNLIEPKANAGAISTIAN